MSAGRLIYVYGIVDEVPADLGLGLDGAPLEAVVGRRAAAIVSAHERAPEADEETLWQHEAVVERLMEDVVVLPMRFGATVAGTRQMAALLHSREEEFVGLLAVVRGAVELSVRAELTVPESAVAAGREGDPGRSGAEYMRDRGRDLRTAEQAKERLHGPLKDLARRSLVLEAAGTRGRSGAFRGAYLVDAGRVDAFAARVDDLARELEGEVSCTGPWPPYSFVAGAER